MRRPATSSARRAKALHTQPRTLKILHRNGRAEGSHMSAAVGCCHGGNHTRVFGVYVNVAAR
jgi:class 3 adenylate cyclase